MTFTAWTEIEGFHNVRKYMRLQPDALRLSALLHGNTSVAYKAKVKLHGTNAAVRCFDDSKVIAQSRSKDLTPEDDNVGFAKWVASPEVEPRFRRLSDRNVVIFGEWCGKGIQKGVAISQVDRLFAVFAARVLGTDQLIIEPKELALMVQGIPGVHVLPWFGKDRTFYAHWANGEETLQGMVDDINDIVKDVETCDPWVKETFGVEGTGEGLVFYPVSKEHLGYESFTYLCFKAKGEKHKNVATAKPAQLNPEAAASIDEFATLVVTEARLMQGVENVALRDNSDTYDMKRVGQFIQWVLADVEKETQDELGASGLTFKQVSKAVSDRARKWYIEKSRA